MQRVSGPCFNSKAILSIFYLFIGSKAGRVAILQNPINSLSFQELTQSVSTMFNEV
jgi:hypothetical protein